MSYYYLISGLPDLNLDEASQNIDYEDIIEVIQRNLEPEDERLFRYLLYPNDNRNLLNVLFHKYKNFPKANFKLPSIIAEPIIHDYLANKAVLPLYLGEFLHSWDDQFPSMALREMEDRLWEYFYQEVERQDQFIADYYRFDRKLKELAAWHNVSQYDFLSKTSLNKGRAVHHPGKVKPGLAELPGEDPLLENLGEAIVAGQPDKIEQCIDQIKWSYLSQVSGFFGREQVFVYVLKLLMIIRGQIRNPEEGENYFKEIQENIKYKVRSPLIQVI